MSDRPVVVHRVGKAYRPRQRGRSLVEELYRAVTRRPPPPLRWVLRDVSFEVPAGTSLGVVGRNGAGKSTLLKIVAGITRPTTGRVEVPMRISTQFALGAGFNAYLTGEENAFLQGTILGLTNREVRQLLPAVTAFAELHEAMHRPLWTYSTGMVARLAFALAAHAQADLMLIDEALSAGDAAFNERCRRVLQDARGAGRTLIVVSHSDESIRSLCDVGLWLDRGEIREMGSTEAVLAAYRRDLQRASG
jgi:ABC-type polysaccharide/polyol phosphate transport system ATPase subunit